MIVEVRGNMFTDNSQAIVIPVNCVGVMGKGVARQYQLLYPAGLKVYQSYCRQGAIRLSPFSLATHFIDRAADGSSQPTNIVRQLHVYFPTKSHWQYASKLSDIKDGLPELHVILREKNIQTVSLPPLGCGAGSLDFDDVYPLIKEEFTTSSLTVRMYLPSDWPKT
jgi:O-acetyl-ADP-ribose deacetylase (regulator of RNase III)